MMEDAEDAGVASSAQAESEDEKGLDDMLPEQTHTRNWSEKRDPTPPPRRVSSSSEPQSVASGCSPEQQCLPASQRAVHLDPDAEEEQLLEPTSGRTQSGAGGPCSWKRPHGYCADVKDGRQPLLDDYEELINMDWWEMLSHILALISTSLAVLVLVCMLSVLPATTTIALLLLLTQGRCHTTRTYEAPQRMPLTYRTYCTRRSTRN